MRYTGHRDRRLRNQLHDLVADATAHRESRQHRRWTRGWGRRGVLWWSRCSWSGPHSARDYDSSLCHSHDIGYRIMQPKGHFTVLVSIYVFQSVAGILMMSEPPPKVGFVGIIIIQSVNMLISGRWKATQESDRDQRPKSHQEFCEECSHETGVLPVAGTQGHQFIRRNCVACAFKWEAR